MRGVEIALRSRRIGADQGVVVVAGGLRSEHIFARRLVVAVTDESLFVAVVDHRAAAQCQQHCMTKLDARKQLFLADLGPVPFHDRREAAHVVIAEECRHAERGFLTAFVEHVAVEQFVEDMRSLALRHGFADRLGESEIEHRGKSVTARVLRDIAIVRTIAVDLAEDVEVGNARFACGFEHGGNEGLPEFGVHMPRCVDAETVYAEVADPCRVNVDHPFDHARMLGVEIVESHEIAEPAAFATEGRVAAIVVIDRVVEPGGDLDLGFRLGDYGCVGIGRIGQPREILGAAVGIAHEAKIDRLAPDTALSRIGIVAAAAIDVAGLVTLGIADDIGCVVGDDVHIDFHPASVRRFDECLEFGARSEMAVGPGKIGHPIAVIASTFGSRVALYGLVLKNRREPDRGDAQLFKIVESRGQTLEVAAMEETLVFGIEPMREPVTRKAALVVRAIAVLEPVGQDEIDNLLAGQALAELGFCIAILRLRMDNPCETEGEKGEGMSYHYAISSLLRPCRASLRT